MSLTGIGEIASFATNLVNKFFPDKSQQEKDALALQIQQMTSDSDLMKGQMEVNTAEANAAAGKLGGLGALFVAGWRPAVGWSCAFAFFWTFVLAPMVSYGAALAGHPIKLPALDLSQMSPILSGMLGLGIMRTVEKVKGLNPGA